MFIYVPDNVSACPAVVVAVHYCGGSAQAYFSGTPYRQLSDTHGFIVTYPESPYSGGCWDVSSQATLRYEGGGSSNAIANMVRWTLTQHSADAERRFVTGTSSGGMMTNALAATYPDLFAAAVAYCGVPAGCFYTNSVAGWKSTCANGNSIASIERGLTRHARCAPGTPAARPRMQIYHGERDNLIFPQNYRETIKQWSGIFGYSGTATQTLTSNPNSRFNREIYGPELQGIWGPQVDHNIPIPGDEDMRWFGITGGGSSPPPTTTAATTTRTTSVSPPASTTLGPPGGCQAQRWGQCGGKGWTGCTSCVSPWTCRAQNQWYSQCL
ncbi:acetylxylan esterase [Plectosphaerella plurivora]|uniref:Carboxylic ester hydrolase n=1 Tax=Plectosphaerella plurivora TaxID=936078 RepID=A0A9P8VGB6_9PEZI|nr:acetylxylan esterase [Plectosphaerella plurivora]